MGGAHWTVRSDFNPTQVSVRVGLEISVLVNDTYNAWIALVAKLGIITVATIYFKRLWVLICLIYGRDNFCDV